LLVLVLTLIAIVADQFAAPILLTTSPLWATFAFLLLVWRRGELPLSGGNATLDEPSFSMWRLGTFVAMHVALVLLSRSFANAAEPFAGTATLRGTLVGLCKLAVLIPTVVLFSFSYWKQLLRAYSSEAKAALLVLSMNVPGRVLDAVWPWYGRVLGWFVYLLARSFVPGLTYEIGPEPTITGPFQDTIIVPDCSGISAFELLGYIFGLVIVLDWNRLRKGRALLIYFGCLFFMLVSNAFRIASLVVLGNRGFADFVSRIHPSAGLIFFCSVFLVYLSLTYKWMTETKKRDSQTITTTKPQTGTLVLWAVIWVLVLVGSAFVFKGSLIKDWIQSLLFAAGVIVWLWLWQSRRQARLRC
jgi:exosortase/archaeosortase family protein